MLATEHNRRIVILLHGELKTTIEDAGSVAGQSVRDFAVSTLAQRAQAILNERQRTCLSERDRERFVALLDDQSTKPRKALVMAAQRYKRKVQ